MSVENDIRQQELYQWVGKQLNHTTLPWVPLTGDASPRRYFQVETAKRVYLAVDSPNEVVDNRRFIALAEGLQKAGLYVPTIYAADEHKGFLLVNELSKQLYSDVLSPDNVNQLYGDAFTALTTLQNSRHYFSIPIPEWTPADYYTEMTDMIDWLLTRHLNMALNTTEEKALAQLFHHLLDNMKAQPQACVHRDYHARNLLYCDKNNPGIIDFQDLFWGPITYDLVSLLRDAYMEWPWEQVQQWIGEFYRRLVEQPAYASIKEKTFYEWFHGMSLQRGIKVLGRFPRLCYRDHKPGYMKDLPRVANYVMASCPFFPGTQVLEDIMAEKILPALLQQGDAT